MQLPPTRDEDVLASLLWAASSGSELGHQEKVNSVQFHGSCPLE